MSLVEIAKGKATDKLSEHSYLPIYELLFAAMKDRPEPVLEIGVAYGGSLSTWLDYFSKAPIIGCDVNRKRIPAGTDPRLRIVQVDAYQTYAVKFLAALAPYGVIIDDGPHTLESQKFFCRHYPQLLADGGIAVVEDIQEQDYVTELVSATPAGFHAAAVDLRHVKGRQDDLLFLIWK